MIKAKINVKVQYNIPMPHKKHEYLESVSKVMILTEVYGESFVANNLIFEP